MREDTLVDPLYEREQDGESGAFYVIKGHCIICGLPPEVARRNITWTQQTFLRTAGDRCPDHCRVEKQPETAEEVAAVIEAACSSCVEAIRYCGTDPDVLARF